MLISKILYTKRIRQDFLDIDLFFLWNRASVQQYEDCIKKQEIQHLLKKKYIKNSSYESSYSVHYSIPAYELTRKGRWANILINVSFKTWFKIYVIKRFS